VTPLAPGQVFFLQNLLGIQVIIFGTAIIYYEQFDQVSLLGPSMRLPLRIAAQSMFISK
jgi:hypothetical protein